MKKLQDRIKEIISLLNKGIYEKEEVVAVSLLAALAGQNIFLLGPPGVAKSLIARRLSSVFETKTYFEYLMQRFSTPEEVFGPISLSELKKDNYTRKTEGYLPKAEFAFLDEIWKSSPAVLNTLLTIINEKKFKNGTTVEDVPLKTLISASNETPPEGQGLDALYDRFLVRLFVSPTQSKDNFEKIIQHEPSESGIELKEKIAQEYFYAWQKEIKNIELSPEVLKVIQDIRVQIEKLSKKDKVYISDRRWQRAAYLLKAAAFFCDRKETNLVDALLLRHCLWSNASDQKRLVEIVEKAVRKNGFETDISFSHLEDTKNKLNTEIQREFYYTEDIYDFVKLGEEKYFKFSIECSRDNREYYVNDSSQTVTYYAPVKKIRTNVNFSPIDERGSEIKDLICNFSKQNSLSVALSENSRYVLLLDQQGKWAKSATTKLKIQYNKGDVKRGVNSRLFESLISTVNELIVDVGKTIEDIECKKEEFMKQLDSPFVSDILTRIAVESIDMQLERIVAVKMDSELLMTKIEKAKN